jgi:hypothetical protein
MKKKTRVPVDLENFQLIAEKATSLPPKQKEPNWRELGAYQRTMDFGGLVPEHSALLEELVRRVGALPKKPN